MYGKIVDGKMVVACGSITIDGACVCYPTDAQARSAGYKPLSEFTSDELATIENDPERAHCTQSKEYSISSVDDRAELLSEVAARLGAYVTGQVDHNVYVPSQDGESTHRIVAVKEGGSVEIGVEQEAAEQ